MTASDPGGAFPAPTVTVVFLAYNRRDELRISLTRTLADIGQDRLSADVVVVDNASTDGTSAMLADEFPGVRIIRRETNSGVSGWNDGFAVATGDYVLAVDDDCYLPPGGLTQSLTEARRTRADLVSFGVVSSVDETHRFDLDEYMTGLLAFWGCAVLVRRQALADLGGFDPEIFIYAHELEFILRFFDRGFRHLHLPEVVAVHMRAPNDWRGGRIREGPYRRNYRNWGYIAAKSLHGRDAPEALIALLTQCVRDGLRKDPMAYRAMGDTLRGFAHGLRHRHPVRPEVSYVYRHDFETFASPWWHSRKPLELLRDHLTPGPAPGGDRGHRDEWLATRTRFYPQRSDILEL